MRQDVVVVTEWDILSPPSKLAVIIAGSVLFLSILNNPIFKHQLISESAETKQALDISTYTILALAFVFIALKESGVLEQGSSFLAGLFKKFRQPSDPTTNDNPMEHRDPIGNANATPV